MEFLWALIGLVIGTFSYIFLSAKFKRKERRFLHAISEERRKVFDMELELIHRRINDIPTKDLLENDEYIIIDDKD